MSYTILAVIKSLALLITLFSWVMIVYAIMKKREFMEARPGDMLAKNTEPKKDPDLQNNIRTQKIAREGWTRITGKIDATEQKDFKSAIIEADALVDAVLKAYNYSGETMGDRMKSIKKDELPSLDDLWQIHKLRNTVAHHPTYEITSKRGESALKTYEKILRELGAI